MLKPSNCGPFFYSNSIVIKLFQLQNNSYPNAGADQISCGHVFGYNKLHNTCTYLLEKDNTQTNEHSVSHVLLTTEQVTKIIALICKENLQSKYLYLVLSAK